MFLFHPNTLFVVEIEAIPEGICFVFFKDIFLTYQPSHLLKTPFEITGGRLPPYARIPHVFIWFC